MPEKQIPTLSAIDLECVRGDRLLFSNLNFCVKAGQWMQIEGENGSGKTSLLRILAGLSQPDSGEVLWRDSAIQTQRPIYFSEMIYQGHALGLKSELSAIENLKVSLALIDGSMELNAIYAALKKVGLENLEENPTRALSAGQRQRITLARLLLSQARLWILDEPFTALDFNGVALVRRLIEEHLQQGGMVILTSHQPVEVRGDRVELHL